MRINSLNIYSNNLYKKSNTLNKNLNFKGFDCSEDDFQIKKLYGIPCPVCGTDMLTRRHMNIIVNDVKDAKGLYLIKLLEKYGHFLHEKEQKAADILKYRAFVNQNDSISELVSQQYYEMLKKVRKSQKRALKELESFLKNQKHLHLKKADEIIKKYEKILQQNENSYLNEKDLFDDLALFFESSLINQDKFRKVLDKFPDTRNEFEFFARFHDLSDSEIAFGLFLPSLSTCEHIIPKSKGGKNNTSNYVAQCNMCNSNRNDMDFLTWIKTKLNFENNFRRYLEKVFESFCLGELPKEYETYFKDITKTLKQETQGFIDVQFLDFEKQDKNEKQDVINDIKNSKDKKQRLKHNSKRRNNSRYIGNY